MWPRSQSVMGLRKLWRNLCNRARACPISQNRSLGLRETGLQEINLNGPDLSHRFFFASACSFFTFCVYRLTFFYPSFFPSLFFFYREVFFKFENLNFCICDKWLEKRMKHWSTLHVSRYVYSFVWHLLKNVLSKITISFGSKSKKLRDEFSKSVCKSSVVVSMIDNWIYSTIFFPPAERRIDSSERNGSGIPYLPCLWCTDTYKLFNARLFLPLNFSHKIQETLSIRLHSCCATRRNLH